MSRELSSERKKNQKKFCFCGLCYSLCVDKVSEIHTNTSVFKSSCLRVDETLRVQPTVYIRKHSHFTLTSDTSTTCSHMIHVRLVSFHLFSFFVFDTVRTDVEAAVHCQFVLVFICVFLDKKKTFSEIKI